MSKNDNFLLKENLHGLYLYNSAGKFEAKYSDIDFIVVIKNYLNNNEITHLEKLHNRLCSSYKYGSRLEGMYLLYADLGKSNNEMLPYPYIDDMKVVKTGYFDVNNITWWTWKEFGIAVNSPSIKEELSHINWYSICSTISYNLNNYWDTKLNNDIIFEDDLWVEFGVVTLSRIVYTLEKKSIESKVEACKYILENFEEWQDVINEALAIRNLESRSIISDVTIRRNKTIEFIRYMINYGNELLQVVSD